MRLDHKMVECRNMSNIGRILRASECSGQNTSRSSQAPGTLGSKPSDCLLSLPSLSPQKCLLMSSLVRVLYLVEPAELRASRKTM